MHNRQLFLKHLAQTSDIPLALEIERASGVYLYDTAGKAYIDLIAGISVSTLGHTHPKVVEAIQEQSQKYLHTLVYGEFVLQPQVQLAQLLAEHLPAPLDCTYIVNSGTEATEGALKLAKRYTGRRKIVSGRLAYHGSTQGALSLMSEPYFTAAFRPLLPEVHHIDFNDASTLQTIDEDTACVILETVRAEIGVMKPQNDFLKKVRERCDEVGALLILDEIQVGCGRTGTLWAFEQYGIIPDILLLAKALGGGMPIGAFISSKKIMDHLSNDPVLGHITTFGGHPVSCAAAYANLKVLTSQKEIIAQVEQKAQRFVEKLQHEAIQEIRYAGLLMAVQLESFEQVRHVIKYGLAHGLVTDWFLFNDKALRIAPPLIISEEEIDAACAILCAGLDDWKAHNQ